MMLVTSLAALASGEETAPWKIVLRAVDGSANGAGALLENRFQELAERLGHEPKGHEWWLWGLTAFDYDRDGDPDLVMSVHGPRHGIVMKNLFRETGELKLIDVTKELGLDGLIPSAAGRKTMAWDFDGDGWLDLIGVNGPHLLNHQGQKFVPSGKQIFDSFRPQKIVDLNGDGFLDVFNEHGRNALYDPQARLFKTEATVDPLEQKFPEDVRRDWTMRRGGEKNRFFSYCYLDEHDLNDDGRRDCVVAGYGGYGGDAIGRYFVADEAGQLTDAGKQLGLPATGTPVLISDLTGDGLPEVLVAADGAGGLFVGEKGGMYRLVSGPLSDHLASRDSYLHIVDVVDFDNDADLDLVVSKPRQGPKVVFENQGEGRFAEVLKQRGWDADPVAVCDFNCDGRVDVAIGGPGNTVTLLINETSHGGSFCELSLVMPGPNVNAVGSQVAVYTAGDLTKAGASPRYTLPASLDGTPVHLGLGAVKTFDLRVTFADGKVVQQKELPVQPRLRLDHDGRTSPPSDR